jgi:hypothetical protein
LVFYALALFSFQFRFRDKVFVFLFFFIYSIMTGKTQTIGSRAQVWHGTAKKTSGGLTKTDLMMNKSHHIVSKAKHFSAKREQRLLKHGYGTKKGKFGFVKIATKKQRKGMKGGMSSLSPMDLNSNPSLTGGSRRRRTRHMRGGSGLAPMSPAGSADWSGDVSLSGGRRRRRMRGGTGNRSHAGVGSDSVQFRAGLGN